MLTGTAGYAWTAVESQSPEVVRVVAAESRESGESAASGEPGESGEPEELGESGESGESAESGESGEVTVATAVAVGVGRAELRSTTSFRGDRFGPRTQLWRLVVDVLPVTDGVRL